MEPANREPTKLEVMLNNNIDSINNKATNKTSLKWYNFGITTIAVPVFLAAKILTQEAPLGAFKLLTGIILSPMHLVQLLSGGEITHKNYSMAASVMHFVRIIAFVATATASPFAGVYKTEWTLTLLTGALNLASNYAQVDWNLKKVIGESSDSESELALSPAIPAGTLDNGVLAPATPIPGGSSEEDITKSNDLHREVGGQSTNEVFATSSEPITYDPAGIADQLEKQVIDVRTAVNQPNDSVTKLSENNTAYEIQQSKVKTQKKERRFSAKKQKSQRNSIEFENAKKALEAQNTQKNQYESARSKSKDESAEAAEITTNEQPSQKLRETIGNKTAINSFTSSMPKEEISKIMTSSESESVVKTKEVPDLNNGHISMFKNAVNQPNDSVTKLSENNTAYEIQQSKVKTQKKERRFSAKKQKSQRNSIEFENAKKALEAQNTQKNQYESARSKSKDESAEAAEITTNEQPSQKLRETIGNKTAINSFTSSMPKEEISKIMTSSESESVVKTKEVPDLNNGHISMFKNAVNQPNDSVTKLSENNTAYEIQQSKVKTQKKERRFSAKKQKSQRNSIEFENAKKALEAQNTQKNQYESARSKSKDESAEAAEITTNEQSSQELTKKIKAKIAINSSTSSMPKEEISEIMTSSESGSVVKTKKVPDLNDGHISMFKNAEKEARKTQDEEATSEFMMENSYRESELALSQNTLPLKPLLGNSNFNNKIREKVITKAINYVVNIFKSKNKKTTTSNNIEYRKPLLLQETSQAHIDSKTVLNSSLNMDNSMSIIPYPLRTSISKGEAAETADITTNEQPSQKLRETIGNKTAINSFTSSMPKEEISEIMTSSESESVVKTKEVPEWNYGHISMFKNAEKEALKAQVKIQDEKNRINNLEKKTVREAEAKAQSAAKQKEQEAKLQEQTTQEVLMSLFTITTLTSMIEKNKQAKKAKKLEASEAQAEQQIKESKRNEAQRQREALAAKNAAAVEAKKLEVQLAPAKALQGTVLEFLKKQTTEVEKLNTEFLENKKNGIETLKPIVKDFEKIVKSLDEKQVEVNGKINAIKNNKNNKQTLESKTIIDQIKEEMKEKIEEINKFIVLSTRNINGIIVFRERRAVLQEKKALKEKEAESSMKTQPTNPWYQGLFGRVQNAAK